MKPSSPLAQKVSLAMDVVRTEPQTWEPLALELLRHIAAVAGAPSKSDKPSNEPEGASPNERTPPCSM